MNTLNKLIFESQKHDPNTLFAVGRLMSPAEVAAATHQRPQNESGLYANRWMLCGDAKSATFDLMWRSAGDNIAFRASAFTTTTGGQWAVMTHQAETHQHRFLIPLWCAKAGTFVQAMTANRHGFSIGRAGSSLALVTMNHIQTEHVMPLLRLCVKTSSREAAGWLSELPMVMSTLGRIEAIPSFVAKQQVTEVSVSTVMPETSPVGHEDELSRGL